MQMDTSTPLAVGSIVLGWLLNELSHRRRTSAARRETLGRALAELLEIHNYVRALDAMLTELQKRWPLTKEEQDSLLMILEHLLPGDATLPERYNRVVDAVAATDPFLAFRLRSKDRMVPFIAKLRTLQLPDGSAASVPIELRELLRKAGSDALEDNLREVAAGFGLQARWKLWRHLRRSPEIPEELQKWLDGTVSAPVSAGGAA